MPRMNRHIPRGWRSKNARRSAAVSGLPGAPSVAAFHGCASMKRPALVAVTASEMSVLRCTLMGTGPQAAGATEAGEVACASAW